LSKLNEALLLLSKKENRRFTAETEVNVCHLIREKVGLIEDLLALKHITISLYLDSNVKAKMNVYLAEILIN
jgi:hypothetical protein